MVYFNNIYKLIIFQLFICSFQNQGDFSYINKNDISIKNAIYIIRNSDGTVNLENQYLLEFKYDKSKPLKKNFELIKNIDNNNNNNEEYFYIRDKELDLYMSSNGKEINFITYYFFFKKDSFLWKIIPKKNESNKLIYYVQNKKYKGFWELTINAKFRLSKKTDISQLNEYNEFQFNELYKDVEKKNSDLLEKEPIDVFIKYIDLNDKNLNRTGICQIKKDEDNQELKYSVRSILKNIPWIRKIFILLPNKKVKFFKPIEEIKEKIVYVKDKDLLGFDSASIYAFLFNIYKMKQFGMSENFILMDDDYFIGQPLNKNDFFYEDNGKILPTLITSDYYEMNKESLEKKLKNYESKIQNIDPHSEIGFYIQNTRALLFAYEIFGNDDIRYGKKLIEPAFTHNAIPVKTSDIKEIHDYVINKYEYANSFLTSLVRTNFDLQMHTLYMAYVKNKYDRKVNRISSGFYDLSQLIFLKWSGKKLFVINTSNKNYESSNFEYEKKILDEYFPKKTEYEIDENEDIIFSKKKDIINENIKNISLIYIRKTNNLNKNIFDSINDLNKSISILFDETNKIITTYENILYNNTIYEDILNEEKEIIIKSNKIRNSMNLLFICNFILFIFMKFYKYFMIGTKIREMCRKKKQYKKLTIRY